MTVINEQPASRKPGTAQQKRVDALGSGAFNPVIQSALGVVRESAGLLYHLAGLGVALVSDPNISGPKKGIGRSRSAAPKSTSVIPFRQLGTSSRRPRFTRNRS
jgi:hypothetical protein